MASSPLRSPFQSIANCVVKVLGWNEKGDSTSPTKNLDSPKIDEEGSKSRSISPEIPKLEEPGQYKLQPEAGENVDPKSSEKPAVIRRSSRIQSGPSTPKTPRSIAKKCSKIESGPNTPRSMTERSCKIQSGPSTPKTPRSSTKRSLMFNLDDEDHREVFDYDY